MNTPKNETPREARRTPLPSIWWDDAEKAWRLVFDTHESVLELDLYADGTCDWFTRNRVNNAYGGTEGPVAFRHVCVDPDFASAMKAIKDTYDGASSVTRRTP